jgi:hypothetical protein
MQYEHLTSVCETLAAHRQRSEMTVARWAGVHGRLFHRLAEGKGCRVDTYNRAIHWFSDNWPADLEWPHSIPRPKKPKEAA